jgi:hypothetical protein
MIGKTPKEHGSVRDASEDYKNFQVEQGQGTDRSASLDPRRARTTGFITMFKDGVLNGVRKINDMTSDLSRQNPEDVLNATHDGQNAVQGLSHGLMNGFRMGYNAKLSGNQAFDDFNYMRRRGKKPEGDGPDGELTEDQERRHEKSHQRSQAYKAKAKQIGKTSLKGAGIAAAGVLGYAAYKNFLSGDGHQGEEQQAGIDVTASPSQAQMTAAATKVNDPFKSAVEAQNPLQVPAKTQTQGIGIE